MQLILEKSEEKTKSEEPPKKKDSHKKKTTSQTPSKASNSPKKMSASSDTQDPKAAVKPEKMSINLNGLEKVQEISKADPLEFEELSLSAMEDIMLKTFRLMFLWYKNDISENLDIQIERFNKRNIDILTNYFYEMNVDILLK